MLGIRLLACLTLGVLLFGGGDASAGQTARIKTQSNSGTSTFRPDGEARLVDFDRLEVLAPVPAFFDPGSGDAGASCLVTVKREGGGVRKAKGDLTAELIVLDNGTGQFSRHAIEAATTSFKTGGDGGASLLFEIPASLFADGFESGDTSAWMYARAGFTNRKRGDEGKLTCGVGAFE